MSANDWGNETYQIDYRTGFPTALSSPAAGERERAACTSLNRGRTRGILEVYQKAQHREQDAADVWREFVTRSLGEWEVPMVALEDLGLEIDGDGYVSTEFLTRLTSGAEAAPFLDSEYGVVYKLFDLREGGRLGKKLTLEHSAQDGYDLVNDDAEILHTVQKLSVLNDAGGLPTEIVGINTTSEFLVVKQPQAFPFKDFVEDQRDACKKAHIIFSGRSNLRRTVGVVHGLEQSWLIADIHRGNVMRNIKDEPIVIDALLGSISPQARKKLSWLHEACGDAQSFLETGVPPKRDLFDGIHDDDL